MTVGTLVCYSPAFPNYMFMAVLSSNVVCKPSICAAIPTNKCHFEIWLKYACICGHIVGEKKVDGWTNYVSFLIISISHGSDELTSKRAPFFQPHHQSMTSMQNCALVHCFKSFDFPLQHYFTCIIRNSISIKIWTHQADGNLREMPTEVLI